ncbi:CBS domain-containing protein [Halosegnis marinus]|uniref:CBS domain-containing protein n=1 Tax=Halosegnis marinus TaxID=3034023 RepID=A0ABD5ZMR6_9EURY|nr:CBS domain-containing protein [Halosegnis sp. DT85]
MEDIFVARLMSTDLLTVSPDTLVEDAAQLMLDSGVGSVLVVDDDNALRGILTSTDFVRIVANQKPKDRTPVSAYMTENPTTTTAQASVTEAADAMLDGGFHHLPVVDDDEGLIGILTTTDLAAYVAGLEREATA